MSKESAYEALKSLYNDNPEFNNSIVLNFELVLRDGEDPKDPNAWQVAISHLSAPLEGIPEEVAAQLIGLTTGLRHGYMMHQDTVIEWAFHEELDTTDLQQQEDKEDRVIN